MKIIDRPKCMNFEKCGNQAIALVNSEWICGHCYVEYDKRIKEEHKKLMIKE